MKMMKYLLFFVSSIMMAQTLKISDIYGKPGSLVVIPIKLENSKSVVALQWVVSYDKKLEISFEAGPEATASSKQIVCNSSDGSMVCVLIGFSDAVIQNGIVAYLNILLPADFSESMLIEMNDVIATNWEAQNIPIEGISGNILGKRGFYSRPEYKSTKPVVESIIKTNQSIQFNKIEIQCGKELVNVGDEVECLVDIEPAEKSKWLFPYSSREDLIKISSPILVGKEKNTFSFNVKLIKDPEITSKSILIVGIDLGYRIISGIISLSPSK